MATIKQLQQRVNELEAVIDTARAAYVEMKRQRDKFKADFEQAARWQGYYKSRFNISQRVLAKSGDRRTQMQAAKAIAQQTGQVQRVQH